jgi:sugar lactone lactonase YvrE
MKTDALTLVIDGLRFPEGNRWHDGQLWFSDMHTGEVSRLDVLNEGSREVVAKLDGQPSGLGWTADNELLISSMFDRQVLKVTDNGMEVYADLSALSAYPINDLLTDDVTGATYVGAFGYDLYAGAAQAPGPLFKISPDGTASTAADGFHFPNSAIVIPGTRTLVIGETWGGLLTAFDIADDGSLLNRRLWADLGTDITPDGSCVDLEGGIWVASLLSSEFLRVTEGGQITDRIPVPGRHAVDCVLGGPTGSTLYLSTADSYTPEVTASTWLGRIEAIDVTTPGALS